MSEENKELAALRARLDMLDRTALVEMCVELSRTYIIEGLGTLSAATDEATPARDSAGEETIAGMLKRLQRERGRDPVLDKFIISGEYIQVKTPMGNVDVTEYRRPTPPQAPRPSAPPPAVPTPRDSVYNRALHEPAPSPSRPPQNSRAQAPQSPPAAGRPEPAKDAPPAGVRHIELD